MAEMNSIAVKSARESIDQIGAMKRVIGRPESFDHGQPVCKFEEFAGLHVASDRSGRPMADGCNRLANANGSQRLDRLRTRVDGSADLSQRRRSLENLGLDSKPLESVGSRQPCQPASDDRYPATN